MPPLAQRNLVARNPMQQGKMNLRFFLDPITAKNWNQTYRKRWWDERTTVLRPFELGLSHVDKDAAIVSDNFGLEA
eukprot:GSA25T00022837001.1